MPKSDGATTAAAVDVLRRHFAFVGLTEFYNLSVCLFHAALPPPADARSPWPRSWEFQNVHAGKGRTGMYRAQLYDAGGGGRYNTSYTEAWHRSAFGAEWRHPDEAVYAAAVDLFWAAFEKLKGAAAALPNCGFVASYASRKA